MDWLSEVIWPLLVAFLALVFRSSIESLSSRLVSLSYKDLSLSFEPQAVKVIAQNFGGFEKYWAKGKDVVPLSAKEYLIALHDSQKYNAAFQCKLRQR